MIKTANVILVEFLSTLAGYANIPEWKAGESGYAHLLLLVAESNSTAVRMAVASSEPPSEEHYLHVVYVWHKCRKRLKTTLNRVFHALLFFDTS